jgi:heavy metal response regulator
MRLLLVEDDKRVAHFIKKGLKENHYAVDVVYDGAEGFYLATHEEYDLIILDIMLPKMEGIEILKGIRKQGINCPVFFLTAKDKTKNIVEGLDAGADDYLAKPFSFNELLARIRALLRRDKSEKTTEIEVANLKLNMISHEAFRGNQKIELTPKEYALLEYFVLNKGQVLTRTMISEHVWDYNFDTMTNVIDVHINHLRNKIDRNFTPQLIHTIKGVGYVLKEAD